MERKITVPFEGKIVEGAELDFETIKEAWNEYKTADGTNIRMKAVVISIIRLKGYDKDGNPIYMVKSSSVLGVLPPEELKKGVTAN